METLRGPARDVLSLLIGGGLGALSVLALWPSLSTAAQAAPCASCAARGASLAAAEEEEEEGLEDSSVVPEEVELKMVLCVRADLNMSKGKVAAQCGHAVLACYRIARRVTPEYVKAWLFRAQAKITLKVRAMDAVRAALVACERGASSSGLFASRSASSMGCGQAAAGRCSSCARRR